MVSLKRAVALAVAVAIVAFAAGWEIAPSARAQGSTASFTATVPLFQEVLQTIEQDYVTQPSESSLIQGAISGMTGALNDPYTEYYTPTQYQQLIDELNGSFSGIGVEINQVGQYIVVQSVLPGSPALSAGLEVGDRITAVGSTSLLGVTPDDAANLIRGTQGSKVTITVLRGIKSFPVTLTREPLTLPTVESKMLPGGIAYILLNQVASNAAAEFTAAVSSLKAQDPKGWILDLRNDPGGLVDQAVSIAQTMIPSGTIVSFKGRVDNQVYTSTSGQKFSQPIVVLVNSGTASAAEIITGALQDDKLATVVGTKTFGKGIAQEIIPMQNGGDLKITVADWYTPKGRNIEHTGLLPDIYADGNEAPLVIAERLLGVHALLIDRTTLGSLEATSNGVSTILDTPPVIHDGQLYVSLETAIQLLGVNAVPNATGNAVTLRYGTSELDMSEGSTQARLNGAIEIVPEPYIANGILMIPVRPLLSFTNTQEHVSGTSYTFENSSGPTTGN